MLSVSRLLLHQIRRPILRTFGDVTAKLSTEISSPGPAASTRHRFSLLKDNGSLDGTVATIATIVGSAATIIGSIITLYAALQNTIDKSTASLRQTLEAKLDGQDRKLDGQDRKIDGKVASRCWFWSNGG